MSYNPTDIRCSPIYIVLFDIVNISHAPKQSCCMPAIITNNTFGNTCGSRCIKNIKWVSPVNRNATSRLSYVFGFFPV